jgi:membrane-associated phospholipid phosphatase
MSLKARQRCRYTRERAGLPEVLGQVIGLRAKRGIRRQAATPAMVAAPTRPLVAGERLVPIRRRCLRYCCLVVKESTSTTGNVLRTLVTGGTVTLLGSWALGSLLQHESVTRQSHRLYEYCREHRSAALARRMDSVTAIGDYSVIGSSSLLVGGILAYDRRDWTPLPLLAGGLVSEVYLQKALKRLVRGTTPPEAFSIGPPGDFPSGGAARTVITFGLLARMLTRRWGSSAEQLAIWSIVTALVAAQGGSRLYLGRHWPEDVVGGWLFGWLVLQTLAKVEDLVSGAKLVAAEG